MLGSRTTAVWVHPSPPHLYPQVFESLACYFPIAFSPPPLDDLNGITQLHLLQALLSKRDSLSQNRRSISEPICHTHPSDLLQALLRALKSSNRFASLALPMLHRSLTSALDDNEAILSHTHIYIHPFLSTCYVHHMPEPISPTCHGPFTPCHSPFPPHDTRQCSPIDHAPPPFRRPCKRSRG